MDISDFNSSIINMVYWTIQVMEWIMSITMTVVCYIWIWVLYKKGVLHSSREQSHRISLKIATLPALMPIVMHIQIFPFFLYFIRLIRMIVGVHWQLLFVDAPYFLSDLSGLVYPIFLLYLNSKVRDCWKKMLQYVFALFRSRGTASMLCCLHCCSKVSLHCQSQDQPVENPTQTKDS